jgi:hypothetical protein
MAPAWPTGCRPRNPGKVLEVFSVECLIRGRCFSPPNEVFDSAQYASWPVKKRVTTVD